MISLLQGSSQLFITELGQIEQQEAQADQQVSSGLAITVASDDPDQISTLLQLRSDLARNTQIQTNLTLAQTNADAADNALSSSIQLMDQAVTLATEGANATMTTDGQESIAQEIQSIQQQMVANSNTMVQGAYIFSGDDPSTSAYTYDANSQATNCVDQGSTAASTQQIEDPQGGSFPASLTAQQIFDDRNSDGTYANDNVFQALNNLYNALMSGSGDAVGATISNLQAASDHLNSMQSFYGEVEDRVQSAQTFANTYGTQLQTEISNIQDADIPTAVMEMTQASTAEEAALQMEAKMPQSTLFDYLG
ncbi:MAG TPA: flagellin [Bryobacteraceae bacterium]|nr:flagellin [Bryobacteraceae bacterium]